VWEKGDMFSEEAPHTKNKKTKKTDTEADGMLSSYVSSSRAQ